MSATLQFQARTPPTVPATRTPPEPRFSLLDSERGHRAYGMTFGVSMLAHAALAAAVIVLPLLVVQEMAPPTDAVRAFFAAPPAVTPPPPPPPPPAAGAVPRRPDAPVRTPAPPTETTFRAPVEVPAELPQDQGIDLTGGFGVEGGVEGGIEGGVVGGVIGGVVGGVVGGIPAATPPPVRVGGNIKAPKVVHRVAPIYPQLARQARVSGLVIIEAVVDDRGAVKEVKLLRGLPLLDEAALAAVRQWRYQPLLLNGQPSAFILIVTVSFNITGATAE
jgi:periplasmic protein TonB